MQSLAPLRWGLLIAAFISGAAYWAPPLTASTGSADVNNLISNVTAFLAPIMQVTGTFAMGAHLQTRGAKAGWAIVVGFSAAAVWLIALLAGLAGQAAGAGGLAWGLLLMLPAAILGPILQIAALIGFANAERSARGGSP